MKLCIHLGDVPYLFHPIPDAVAMKYFYTNYDELFREDLIAHMQFYEKEMSGYSVLFTGHSLGGALAVLAAFDMYL
jgi:predicted alpha/beta hydrolase